MFSRMNNNKPDCTFGASSGITILELLMAVAISSVVVGLVFFASLTAFRAHRTRTTKGMVVLQMVTTRSQMKAVLREISAVYAVSRNQVTYKSKGHDSIHTLSFNQPGIHRNRRVTQIQVRDLVFKLHKNARYPGVGVLQWDAETQDAHWIGGAKVVNLAGDEGETGTRGQK